MWHVAVLAVIPRFSGKAPLLAARPAVIVRENIE